MDTINVIIMVAIIVIILYADNRLKNKTNQNSSSQTSSNQTNQTSQPDQTDQQPIVIDSTDKNDTVPKTETPVILYDEKWYQGNATVLKPGEDILVGNLNSKGEGNCPNVMIFTINDIFLDCWDFKYASIKMDPNYNVYFYRSSGGTKYTQKIDPSITGNMPILDARVLESYVDVSNGNPYSTAAGLQKTAALPYYYWTNPLYIKVEPKPKLPNGEVYKVTYGINDIIENQTVSIPKITASIEEADNMASTNEGFCISSGV